MCTFAFLSGVVDLLLGGGFFSATRRLFGAVRQRLLRERHRLLLGGREAGAPTREERRGEIKRIILIISHASNAYLLFITAQVSRRRIFRTCGPCL